MDNFGKWCTEGDFELDLIMDALLNGLSISAKGELQ